MMPFIQKLLGEAMLATGSSLAASIVTKTTLTMALGLMSIGLSRRSPAAVLHALLTAMFGVLLALPIAAILIPPFRIMVPAAKEQAVLNPPSFAPAATFHVLFVARGRTLSEPALLLSVWIAGTLLFLLPVGVGLWQFRSLRRSAVQWPQGQSPVEGPANDAGHRLVEVLLHDALPGPMTCGIVNPAILLPRNAEKWEPEDLNRALIHELEHVRRLDRVSHCLARSCDDAVLRRSEPTAYADQLVGLAQRLSTAAKPPLLAMANRADLAARVGAILDGRQRRGRAGAFAVALACFTATVLTLAMSPLRMVAAPQDINAAPIFVARSTLVVVAVTVTDQSGQNPDSLTANDFVVIEDGVQQTIRIFEHQNRPGASPVSNYYLVGYYTRNPNVADAFGKIAITLKDNSAARLQYRSSYPTSLPNFAAFAGVEKNGAGNSPGLDIKYPALIFKQDPEYSGQARKAKWQGALLLSLIVDDTGHPQQIKVSRGLGLGLDQNALEAVEKRRFKPGLRDGKPVAMRVQAVVEFRLP